MTWTAADREALETWTSDNESLAYEIESLTHPRATRAGETLMIGGAAASEVLLILQGEVSIINYSESGHAIRLSTLKETEWVGEVSVLNRGTRTAFAIAANAGRIASLPANKFLSLMHQHGDFSTKIAKLLGLRLTETSRRMFEFATLPAPDRVYAELVRLSVQDTNSSDQLISPAPSVTELAARLSIARETTSRAVTRLERMKLLSRDAVRWRVKVPEGVSTSIN